MAVVGAVGAAAWTPAADSAFPGRNGEIAYSIELPNGPEGLYGEISQLDLDVCTIRPLDRTRRRITGPESFGTSTSGAAWSPDGMRLALSRYSESLALVDANGTHEVHLRPSGHAPSWAPGADRLVYVSNTGRIAVISAAGDPVRVLAERGETPAWSPDGSRIAYVEAGQIVTVAADGTGRLQLTSDDREHASPNWSPDSSTIVFAEQGDRESDLTIARVGASGGTPVRLKTIRRFSSPVSVDPTFSPDGTKIAYVAGQSNHLGTDVYTMNVDGSSVVNVTRSPFSESSIDWGPLPASGYVPPGRASCGVGGTPAPDTLIGTGPDDVVYALGGADRIMALGGHDIVLAGAGPDSVSLGAGDDLAYGEDGNDTVRGEAGRDDIAGGRGDDRLDGGPGEDVLGGGYGNDVILASDGSRDDIRCGPGRDVVFADRRDRFHGGQCERVIRR
jgi:dipeptidyl aminopeptidase/acylaminoacyl peptidase